MKTATTFFQSGKISWVFFIVRLRSCYYWQHFWFTVQWGHWQTCVVNVLLTIQSERFETVQETFSFRHFTLINGLKRMTLKPDKGLANGNWILVSADECEIENNNSVEVDTLYAHFQSPSIGPLYLSLTPRSLLPVMGHIIHSDFNATTSTYFKHLWLQRLFSHFIPNFNILYSEKIVLKN